MPENIIYNLFRTEMEEYYRMLNLLNNSNSVCPSHFYSHKSKTFKKNRRKELKRRNTRRR